MSELTVWRSPEKGQTRRCSGDDEAGVLERARVNGAHGQVRLEVENKLVRSGRREAAGCGRNCSGNLVEAEGFELAIGAAQWQRGGGVWGER